LPLEQELHLEEELLPGPALEIINGANCFSKFKLPHFGHLSLSFSWLIPTRKSDFNAHFLQR
jgi:hypothetical protein